MKELAKSIQQSIEAEPFVLTSYKDLYSTLREIGVTDTPYAVELAKWLSNKLSNVIPKVAQFDVQLAQELIELHKQTLLEAAPYDFDSYCLYLEFDRDPEKKFYAPRRKVLKPLVDDLQDLYDGKIDFLGVSLPPRVGKALANDTPVLTRRGWKKHGDLIVGDEVVSPDSSFVKVLAVYPPCKMEYEVTFTNGEKIICHGNHEWKVNKAPYLMSTVSLMKGHTDYQIVSREAACGLDKLENVGFASIKPVEGDIEGNCITVEGGMYCVGKTLIPTHNSTLGIFFMTWVMGNRPDAASVMSGHSDKLTDGFYREIMSILSDPDTYLWPDVFPGINIVDNSAKNETIDLHKRKRFPTMTCRSISGTLTGAVEVGNGGILYCDDLIEDLEESLNPQRLENKYEAYLNQLKDRKKLGAKELMVGTRWNVFDPLGRIQMQYADNPRYRFRVLPAVDENGESNFNYPFELGFTTEYYRDMKESIDDATWNAKYMGTPYVREGLLFPEDELLTYNGVLPDGEPDKIAVCDVAWGGGDSTAMPIAYIYGKDVYIHDVMFNNGDKTVTYPEVIAKLKQHIPSRVRFEANNGGHEYADHVDEMLRQDGVRINIFSKRAPTTQSKLSRIIQYAPDIKKFYFLGDKYRSQEYRAFMREVTLFVQTGKNPHDDAPDSLAQLADELYYGVAKITVMERPF